jgi:hypothetical protein
MFKILLKLLNTKTRSFENVDKIFTWRVCVCVCVCVCVWENTFVRCCMVVIPDTLFYQFNVFITKKCFFFLWTVYRLTVSRSYFDTGSAAVAESPSNYAMLRQQINHTMHFYLYKPETYTVASHLAYIVRLWPSLLWWLAVSDIVS